MHEFVDNGKTGFVVKQNSGEAIAVPLRQLIDATPTQSSEHQTRCRKWVKQFDWATVVDKHVDLYKESVKRRPQSLAA
jgi:glycosyltransferase involved in cell wall biosynthesis